MFADFTQRRWCPKLLFDIILRRVLVQTALVLKQPLWGGVSSFVSVCGGKPSHQSFNLEFATKHSPPATTTSIVCWKVTKLFENKTKNHDWRTFYREMFNEGVLALLSMRASTPFCVSFDALNGSEAAIDMYKNSPLSLSWLCQVTEHDPVWWCQ